MKKSLDLVSFDSHSGQLLCRGEWDLTHLSSLEHFFQNMSLPSTGEIEINGKEIKKLDSAGAWLLSTWQHVLEKKGLNVRFEAFPEKFQKLLSLIQERITEEKPAQKPEEPSFVEVVGKYTYEQYQGTQKFLSFIGLLATEAVRVASSPRHWRWNAFLNIVYNTGYLALPIIALLSFMIGIVITYQMGLQLRTYGANIYIVDLLGLSILREFGPLLTAIMVAGRTGSAFTAQLGMMKLNQEIDALDTMGVTPSELLLLPRIGGLLIALPLLTVWADIFGVIGGMIMAGNMLDISWFDFLSRFPRVIPLKTLLIGLAKAPVFALVIASTGCYQGMQVRGGADSVGRNTTRSVVLSIFFIIVFDAIFSVILSKLKL